MNNININTGSGSNSSLCNHIIRDIALSLLAKKYNLKTKYAYEDVLKNRLGLILYSGNNTYNNCINVNNNNYLHILFSQDDKFINKNFNLNNDYFQSEEITNIIMNYLRDNKQKVSLISKNKYNNLYKNNNNLFIHIRLGDAKKYNVGLHYYLNAIKNIKYNNIYIASDSLNDELIKNIQKIYQNITLIKMDPIATIQFGCICKNIILSHGTFSAIIGYLSFDSNIYYPEVMPISWCPIGLFTNKSFIAMPIK